MIEETNINKSVFDVFPELESERLLFKAYTKKDAQTLLNLRSNKAISKYMDTTIPKRIEDTEQRIEGYIKAFKEEKGITWAIIEKENNTIIGDFAIHHIDKQNSRGEIGYILHPNFWGKGYMTEALTTLINFGFQPMLILKMSIQKHYY